MRNILIIGTSAGIGYGLTNKFLNNNYHVIAISRHINSLNTLKVSSGKLTLIQADITNSMHQINILEKLSAVMEPIEIINNAAIGNPQPFQNLDMKELRQHFETNFFAPVQLLKNILSQNIVSKVFNISSGAAEFPLESLFSYCTSKASMHHAIKCLNLEYFPIKFSNIRPGMVSTPLQERWRTVDNTVFPKGNLYIKAKDENKLISVETVADFVYWISTNSLEFKEIWNIYDTEHHKYWLRTDSLFG